MNKIKLLLLLLMAVTGMAAFADDASFEFVESDGTLTIRGYGDLTNYSQTSNEGTVTFKEALLAKINNVAYTKVAFDNIGSGALTIDPEIVQQILYPYDEANNTITELDLGEATTNTVGSFDLTSMYGYTISTFEDLLSCPNKGWIYPGSLAKLTLPLVAKDGDEMVLPAMMSVPENLTTVTVPQGYTKIGNAAFLELGGSEVAKINLPEGLKEIGNRSFISNVSLKEINITGAEQADRKLVLPSTLEVIQDDAFRGCELLSSTEDDPFILPASLKKIGIGAFYNLKKMEFLQLNEGLEYVGNSAFGLDAALHAQAAITFPSTIQYLGPASFVNRWYEDVYFTSDVAPVCPTGQSPYPNSWGNTTAFSANIHMGNNGFTPNGVYNGSTADDTSEGYANRENYVTQGYYFTVLHFPTGKGDDAAKTYKDITRRYVTARGNEWDQSGNTFYPGGNIAGFEDPATPGKTFGSAFQETTTYSYGNYWNWCTSTNVQPGYVNTYQGAQVIWPSQAQWMRSYIMVANGLSWDGVTKYRPEVTKEMFDMMKEDGLVVNQDNDEAGINLSNKSYSDLTDTERDYLSKILYQGTRRFVLSNDSPYEIPFILKLETGRWWSICLPFNMTKAQVDKVFGAGTHVCLFSGVDRTNDENGKILRLKFTNDVYHHKTKRVVTSLDGGNALGYVYGANYSKTSGAPEENDIVIYARESYMIYPMAEDEDASGVAVRNFGIPEFTVGDPLPTMIQANSETPYTIDGKDVAYRHIGNFNTTASYDEDGNSVPVKIPRYSYAYGQSGGVTKFFILNKDNAVWTPFKSIVQNLARNGGEEDWKNFFQESPAGAKQVSVFGLEEDITGVENVIIEASSDNGADKAVYSINGSYVGDSLQGLAPGVYVQQGKAYIVE